MHFYNCTIKRILFFCSAIFFISKTTAQTIYQLPPNQPEQDACNALPLCGGIFSTPYSYTGYGNKLDIDQSPCLAQSGGGEQNSVWLQVRVASPGSIVFKLKPVEPEDDYDFAVINATGKDCNALTPADVVRCNYNNNFHGSNLKGIIGLDDTSRTAFIKKETFGYSLNEPVFAKSNEVYLIMINNYGNYVAGGPSKGFTIDFTGSSAVFYNTASPQLSNINVPCNNATSITIKTSTPVLCSSIAADGSGFTTNAPVKIISASGANCNDRGGYTNSIVINFSSALPPGKYTINAQKANNNTILAEFCNNQISVPSAAVSFIVKANGKVTIENQYICYQQLPYTWNGIQIKNTGDSAATYTTPSAAGCDSTTILNLQVAPPPKQMSISRSICDGDSYVLPWGDVATKEGTYTHHFPNANGCDSIIDNVALTVVTPSSGNVEARDSTIQRGFCKNGSVILSTENTFVSYLWNTGQTSSSIVASIAGAYSLIAQDSYGCITIDTFVVAAYPYPTPYFNRIENLCDGEQVSLDAGISSTYYLWNNGSNAETVITNKPGKFWVTLTNTFNCTITDTVDVFYRPSPSHFLMPDITKCPFTTVTLAPFNNYNKYTWNNGRITKSIDVSAGGMYWLTATDVNGCTGRDTIRVIDSICPVYFYVPTAFTPNSDKHNDVFKPLFDGVISNYHFSIYNRWGKLIFSSTDPHSGWNGIVDHYHQPTDVYIWTCSYILNGHPLRNDRGTVMLLR